jgi:hypothetical protein
MSDAEWAFFAPFLIENRTQGIRLTAAPDRHDQGVGHELRRHLGLHRPADDTP